MADQVAEEALAPETVTLDEGLGWVGWKLDGYSGSSVGRGEGVLADADSGEPVWLVGRMGRLGHFYAVPFALAAAGVGRVWVPYERDLIRGAPRIEPGAGLTREQELELCEHFHIPGGHGRAGTLAARPEGSETAVIGSAQAQG